MSKEFDEKLRKAIQDLQIQTLTTNQRIAEIEQTQRIMEQNVKVSEIVKSEVNSLSAERGVYHNIGRVFVYRTHNEEIADQNKDIDLYTTRISELAKQKDHLQRSLADNEQNVREILQSRQK